MTVSSIYLVSSQKNNITSEKGKSGAILTNARKYREILRHAHSDMEIEKESDAMARHPTYYLLERLCDGMG